jgi:hypothetical protein
MFPSASLLKAVRLTHLYVGVFVAPAILFFAFTGAVQTFSLHETTKGSDYRPPRILVILAQIHKKQTPVVTSKAPAPSAATKSPKSSEGASNGLTAPKPAPPAAPDPQKQHNPWPLKIFFLLASISLCISTFSGIYMSYRYVRNQTLITTLLILGVVVPVLMILA